MKRSTFQYPIESWKHDSAPSPLSWLGWYRRLSRWHGPRLSTRINHKYTANSSAITYQVSIERTFSSVSGTHTTMPCLLTCDNHLKPSSWDSGPCSQESGSGTDLLFCTMMPLDSTWKCRSQTPTLKVWIQKKLEGQHRKIFFYLKHERKKTIRPHEVHLRWK